MNKQKRCSTCKLVKDINSFNKSENETLGVGHQCRDCLKIRLLDYRNRNRKRISIKAKRYARENREIVLGWTRKSHYKTKYGLDYSEVIKMWEERDKCCEICGEGMTLAGWKSNSACIDHNHKTGKIRGMICLACNHAIGMIKENSQTAIAIAFYLRNYKETQK